MSASFFKINQVGAKDLKTISVITSTNAWSTMFSDSNIGVAIRDGD
jgi:hypothetical protein